VSEELVVILTAGRLSVELSPVFGSVCELKKNLETGSHGPEAPGQRIDDLIWWAILDSNQ
jgi:hypothetical protein